MHKYTYTCIQIHAHTHIHTNTYTVFYCYQEPINHVTNPTPDFRIRFSSLIRSFMFLEFSSNLSNRFPHIFIYYFHPLYSWSITSLCLNHALMTRFSDTLLISSASFSLTNIYDFPLCLNPLSLQACRDTQLTSKSYNSTLNYIWQTFVYPIKRYQNYCKNIL